MSYAKGKSIVYLQTDSAVQLNINMCKTFPEFYEYNFRFTFVISSKAQLSSLLVFAFSFLLKNKIKYKAQLYWTQFSSTNNNTEMIFFQVS